MSKLFTREQESHLGMLLAEDLLAYLPGIGERELILRSSAASFEQIE